VIPLLLAPRDPDERRGIECEGSRVAHDRATLLAQIGGAVVAVAALVAIFVTG
jgi:hypothetical protein